jgi:hypothetical protein
MAGVPPFFSFDKILIAFNSSIKRELIQDSKYDTPEQAQSEIFQ